MPRFSGIIPPVVTPLRQTDQLAVDAVDRITEHLIDGGVSGLFLLGTTGEGPSLTYQIRYEMVERVCEAAGGQVPVLVGITDCSLPESVHLAEHAFACGASAVVAASPWYFAIGQEAAADWFRQLADASPLPLLLYNMPGCVEIHLDIETVTELSGHPNIVGVKDSSGDVDYFRQLCETFRSNDDFAVFMGPEELISEAVAAGADGGVCGGGNLLPGLYVRLFNAAKDGNEEQVTRLKKTVDAVFRHIYHGSDGRMNLIPALKFAMEQCGLCPRLVVPPLQPVAYSHQEQIKRQLPDVLELADSPLAAERT